MTHGSGSGEELNSQHQQRLEIVEQACLNMQSRHPVVICKVTCVCHICMYVFMHNIIYIT